jgi:hypothetical protein
MTCPLCYLEGKLELIIIITPYNRNTSMWNVKIKVIPLIIGATETI